MTQPDQPEPAPGTAGRGDVDPPGATVPRNVALVLLAASSLTVMAGATLAPALPSMAEHFRAAMPGADPGRVDLLVRLALTGPGLFTAVVSLLAGPIVDRLGRVLPLVVGLVLYVAAGTSGLYLQDLTSILIGRALLGAAVALVMVSTTTLIADLFTGPDRRRFTGRQSAAMSFGGVGFLVVAGFLADVGWRAPFIIYFAALLVLAGALATLRGRGHAGGIRRSEQAADTPSPAPIAAAAGVMLLGFVAMALFYMIPTHLPFRIAEMGVVERKWAGIAIALNGLVAGVVSLLYGRVRERLGFRAVAAAMFLLMAIGYAIIAAAPSYPVLLAGVVINGLGQGFMLPNAMSWMQAIAPERLRGRLTGFLVSAVFLGQFLSPILSKPLGDRFGLAGEYAIAAGFMLALSAGLGLAGMPPRRPGVR